MQIVDHLHVNVVQRTVHVESRTLRRALHLFADAVVHVAALMVLRNFRQHMKALSYQPSAISKTLYAHDRLRAES